MAERPTPAAVFARPARASADDLLRRADALRRAARQPRSARRRASSPCAAASRPARRCPRISASAGRRALRRRDPRRHRLDRDAAHLPLEPARRRCATAPPASRCRATRSASSTRRAGRSRTGEIGELQVSGPTSAAFYWNNRERSAHDLPRRLDAQRRQIRRERRRLLHLLRPHRRHAEGRRHLRLALRGRGGAAQRTRAVLEAAVIGQRRRARPDQAQGLCRGEAGHRAATPPSPRRCSATSRTASRRYKYPRWIEFVAELPKTATGKIQRFKLRERSAG